ncbi:hypothetical protein [Altericroceibacterium xinjiangense]|uniref:hypothetical protein n=1 Tax=Altericroceibacterium xinjiangense TaxID=762261 RepID=UPI000F7DB742|nr:hypothetical protein [Altericroceibacterium xinjiangense]
MSTTIAVLLIGGCSAFGENAPRIVSADALGITYRVAPDNQSTAVNAAKEYCQSRSRSAQLRSVTPSGDNKSTMSFACI